jgi:hypothetical protein
MNIEIIARARGRAKGGFGSVSKRWLDASMGLASRLSSLSSQSAPSDPRQKPLLPRKCLRE